MRPTFLPTLLPKTLIITEAFTASSCLLSSITYLDTHTLTTALSPPAQSQQCTYYMFHRWVRKVPGSKARSMPGHHCKTQIRKGILRPCIEFHEKQYPCMEQERTQPITVIPLLKPTHNCISPGWSFDIRFMTSTLTACVVYKTGYVTFSRRRLVAAV